MTRDTGREEIGYEESSGNVFAEIGAFGRHRRDIEIRLYTDL